MATLNEVITGLEAEQISVDTALMDELGLEKHETSTWYIQGLLGCGGWLGAIFFIVFAGWWLTLMLISVPAIGQSILWTMTGVFLVFTTLAVRRSGGGIIKRQVALVCQITGQLLIAMGLSMFVWEMNIRQYPLSVVALVMIVLEVILIRFYPDSLFRFLAFGAMVGAIHVIIFEMQIPYGVPVITGLLAGLNIWLWGNLLSPKLYIQHDVILNPIRYASIVALFATIIMELMFSDIYQGMERDVYAPWLTTIFLFIAMAIFITRLLPEIGISNPLAIVIVSGFMLIIAVLTYTSPGILAGLLLLLLGYRRRNTVVIGLAVACIAGFVFFYYYNLQTTLLVKSLTMVATGATLLAGRVLLSRFGTQETSS